MIRSLTLKRRLAATVFPRYSELIDKLNWTARWTTTIKSAGDVPTFPNRKEMYTFLFETYGGGGPIDYLEFGVYEGGTMRLWCDISKDPESRFVGFDSFKGLPENWLPDYPQGAFDVGGNIPDIKDPRLHFEVGWFQDTLPPFLASYQRRPNCPLFVNNDSDLYSSTLFCLTSMNAILTPGTIVIMDEFFVVVDEFKALTDYCRSFNRDYKIVATLPGFTQTAVQIL